MSPTPDQAAAAIKALNDLIQTCKDGEKGFQSAAAAVKTPRLGALFGQYSRQRGLFARQLQAAVRRLDGEPRTNGSLGGTLQRSWVNFRALASGKDNEDGVIAACERGEDGALKAYEEALAADLPLDIRATVQAQYAEVQKVHEHIRALEGAHDTQ